MILGAIYDTTRTVTTYECNWLKNDIPEGSTLFEYTGQTFGCVNNKPGDSDRHGKYTAVCNSRVDSAKFFGFPTNALEEVG